MKRRVTSDGTAYCTLDEAEIRTIIDKNPVMEETFKVWRELSIDPEILSLEEARRKGRLDYNTNMLVSRAEGRVEGMAKLKAPALCWRKTTPCKRSVKSQVSALSSLETRV